MSLLGSLEGSCGLCQDLVALEQAVGLGLWLRSTPQQAAQYVLTKYPLSDTSDCSISLRVEVSEPLCPLPCIFIPTT